METDYRKNLDALERACEEVLDAETLKVVIAAKRRIATDENLSSVGNAAKMREVLELCMALFKDGTIHTDGGMTDEEHDAIDNLYHKVKAALSAPARNCDRFGGDIDRLREACLRERGLNPEEDFPEVFCEWLLEIAEVRHA